jgi:hypothetical protein
MSEPREIVSATDEHAAQAPIGAARGTWRQAERPLASPHSHKFQAATAALAGLAIVAIVVAIAVLSSSSTRGPSVPWSAWQPADGGSVGAREIADHIAPLYRISPVDQLAVVTTVGLSNSPAAATNTPNGSAGSSGLQVAVRPDPSSSAVSLLTGNTVAYNLCGIGGSNCAIGAGQPSPDRLLLLRREALELALYTFRYIGGVDNVVAILPPGHTSTATAPGTLSARSPLTKPTTKPLNVALLFLHGELRPLLAQPLGATLPEEFPPTVVQMRKAPEAGLVEQVTARGMFSQRISQAQDGSSLIVLDQLPPQ